MKYINISTLKKQAKRNRKNNQNIKNHAESLNLIAREYNFDKWEDLIDNSVLLIQTDIKQDKKSIKDENPQILLEKIINNISNRYNFLKEIMLNEDYYYLAKTLHNLCMSNTEKESMWEDRAFILMKTICFLFYKTTKNKTDHNYLYSLLNRETFLGIIEKNFKELMKYPIISDFINNHLCYYTKPTMAEPNPTQNEVLIEQYGYLTMQYSVKFGILIEELEVFKSADKYAIIEELKNPKSVLAYSVYFDKDKEFVNYMITLLGKEVSFYDKEFREKNLDLLNKIKTEL